MQKEVDTGVSQIFTEDSDTESEMTVKEVPEIAEVKGVESIEKVEEA